MGDENPTGRDQPAERADNQHPAHFGQTPWQTVGPFFHYALPWKGGADLVGASGTGARTDLFPAGHDRLHATARGDDALGERIDIVGHVLDACGAPVPDAMLEIWQANAAGRYASPADGRGDVPLDPAFRGFGRSSTSAAGEFRFRTIMPGRVPGPGNSLQAAHVAMGVFGRGLLKRLVTRVYFLGAPGLAEDVVLGLVPVQRRETLLARPAGSSTWNFDIILGGQGETVFFEV